MTSPTTCHVRPVARCSRCRAITTDATRINTTCGRPLETAYCRGILRCALRPNDWAECPECKAEPRSSVRCERCSSSGWLSSGLNTLSQSADLKCQFAELIVIAHQLRAQQLFNADALRGLANRAGSLARSMPDAPDHTRLLRQARQLEEIANHLEVEASLR